uniref:Uncharacterized protein n=1 Tax=Anguilla anguilla TaxID=7936 RepID=A0A0E9U036_ANGAN
MVLFLFCSSKSDPSTFP